MSLKAGDSFPSGILRIKDHEGIKEISTEEYFKSRKVVLFALPGAFTPTCSAKHLPGFINNYEKIISKGVIICIDPAAIMFLIGSEMDYKEEKFSSGFDFNNPNEIARCGCGESFTVA